MALTTARHAAEELSPLGRRLALIIERAALDLRFTRMAHAAEYAAVRILADDEIADGQRARAVLAALDARHQPRTWVGGHTVVCAACETAWPCRDRELLDATQTPAGSDRDPATPGGTSPGARQVGEATLPRPGFQPHQPEWDGNRCANCNGRLTDGGPCPMAEPATDEMTAVAS